jgi:hypothetical protein
MNAYVPDNELVGRGQCEWNATVGEKSLSDLSLDFIIENQSLNVELISTANNTS